jgi:hypothetical protein
MIAMVLVAAAAGFDHRGWKLPVTLAPGKTATLSVPRGAGLMFTGREQRRLTFEACDEPPATAWPGGIVVDRRRCATLRLKVAGRARPIRRRVPLGKRCGQSSSSSSRARSSAPTG